MWAMTDLNTGTRSKAAARPPPRHGRNWVWEGDGWARTGPQADTKVDKQVTKHEEITKVEKAKKVKNTNEQNTKSKIVNTMVGTAVDTRDENTKEQQQSKTVIRAKVKKFRQVKKDKTATKKATTGQHEG